MIPLVILLIVEIGSLYLLRFLNLGWWCLVCFFNQSMCGNYEGFVLLIGIPKCKKSIKLAVIINYKLKYSLTALQLGKPLSK